MTRNEFNKILVQSIMWALGVGISVGIIFALGGTDTGSRTSLFIFGAMLGFMVGSICGAVFAATRINLGTGWTMLVGAVAGLFTGFLFVIYDLDLATMTLPLGVGLGAIAGPLFQMRIASDKVEVKVGKMLRDKHLFWPITGVIIGAIVGIFTSSVDETSGFLWQNFWLVGVSIGLIVGIIIEIILIRFTKTRNLVDKK